MNEVRYHTVFIAFAYLTTNSINIKEIRGIADIFCFGDVGKQDESILILDTFKQ